MAHQVLGLVYPWRQQPAQAIAALERAIALDPNNADGYTTLAHILSSAAAIKATSSAPRLRRIFLGGTSA